jgi:hypothetical protein
MTVNRGYRQANVARTGWGWLTLLFLIALLLCALWIWADQQTLQYQWIAVSAVIVGMCMFAGWLVNGRLDGILIDERNRISLSRLQWMTWFIVLLGGYFAAAVWNVRYMEHWDIKGHFPDMQADLWALLGIVSASAVASNLIVDRKKSQTGQASNAAVNTAALPTSGQSDQVGSMDRNFAPGEANWADLFLGEEVANRYVVDISRLQKLFVTVLLAVAYIRRAQALHCSRRLVRHDDGARRAEHAAHSMADRDLGIGDLGGGGAAHLTHALLQCAVHAGMHVGEAAAVGSVVKLPAGFSLLALVRQTRRWRERESNSWSPLASRAMASGDERDSWWVSTLGIEAGQAASSALPSATLVHPAQIKQSASWVDISTMRSSPIVMRRPDSVWTAPIPGGASRRT